MKAFLHMPTLCGVAGSLALLVTGCTNVLGFGTATKFALDISQRADQSFDVSMGYDRVEVASIPAPKKDDAVDGAQPEDVYSVLGTFKVTYGTPWTEGLVLDQFFATGLAARSAAQDAEFQAFFGHQAGSIAAKQKTRDAGTDREPRHD